MNLLEAVICLDCEEISVKNGNCPKCGGHITVPVSRWLPSVANIRLYVKIVEVNSETG